jgi:hypothetical protein
MWNRIGVQGKRYDWRRIYTKRGTWLLYDVNEARMYIIPRRAQAAIAQKTFCSAYLVRLVQVPTCRTCCLPLRSGSWAQRQSRSVNNSRDAGELEGSLQRLTRQN